MSFLHDKSKPRKGRQGGLNLDTEDSDSSSDNSSNDTQSTSYDENLDQESSGNPPDMPSGTPEEAAPEKGEHSFTVPKASTKKPKPTATNMRQEAFEMMKSVYDNRKTKENSTRDDFEVFGELVGRIVRSLKTNYAKAKVQHLINNILYDAEVGKYDQPTPTITYYTSPSASSSGAPSPNSVTIMSETSASQEGVPGQIVEETLIWAIATPQL